jgi:nicotinate-nucleotide pyrophosphorylase (carboxylating)
VSPSHPWAVVVNLSLAHVHKEFSQLEWSATLEDDLRQLVRLAVREDLDRQNDWTTVSLIDSDRRGRAAIVAREPGTVAGLRTLPIVIDEMQAAIQCHSKVADSEEVAAGTVLAELSGAARDMLTCERPLLNLLGRLSGIATLTRQFVRRVEGTGARIYDTRKTTPGWRRLEKYAVRCGGGHNHRTGLFDAILIKDNHLALAAEQGLTPAKAVERAREFVRQMTPASFPNVDAVNILIEVEVDSLTQLTDALAARPDIVLLDNMSPKDLKAAMICRQSIAPEVELEASGGVSLETVRSIAETGVERISAGSLTHSARSLDVALDWRPDVVG